MDEVAEEFRSLEVAASPAIHPETLGADTWELHAVQMPAKGGTPGFTGVLALGKSGGKARYALSIDAVTRDVVLVDETTGADLQTRLKAQGKEFADELNHLQAIYVASASKASSTRTQGLAPIPADVSLRPQDAKRDAQVNCIVGGGGLALIAAALPLVGLLVVVHGATVGGGLVTSAGAAMVIGVAPVVLNQYIEEGKVAVAKIPADVAQMAKKLFTGTASDCKAGFARAKEEVPPAPSYASPPPEAPSGATGAWCVGDLLYADRGKTGTGYLVGKCTTKCTMARGIATCE